MTIRSTESLGTEMRRTSFLALCLALLLLLCGCSTRFERDTDGFGYTDTKTDVHYTALSYCYEAASAGEEVGEYTDRKHDYTTVFYQIPKLDTALYITDDSGAVYCAADPLPDAKLWTLSTLLICQEDAISVEERRLEDATTIAMLQKLWFEGEDSELPITRADYKRRLKMGSTSYPNLYYCISFFAYEDGTAYLYDAESGRTVVCTAEAIEAVKGK